MQSAGEKYAPPQNFFGGYYTNSGQVCKAFSPRESNFLCKFAHFSHKIEKAEKLPPFAVRIFRPAGSLFRVGVGEDQIVDERIGEGLRVLFAHLADAAVEVALHVGGRTRGVFEHGEVVAVDVRGAGDEAVDDVKVLFLVLALVLLLAEEVDAARVEVVLDRLRGVLILKLLLLH